MNIYLIGFMGSGKTTIGEILHKHLQMGYTDTDAYIEKTTGRVISEIFASEGEGAFRTYETEALKQIPTGVIATGGGIVETEENISYMQENGIIIYLKASLETIEKRLEGDLTRPLWKQSTADRFALFTRRHELYESAAQIIVETDHKTAEKINAEVVSLLENNQVHDCQ